MTQDDWKEHLKCILEEDSADYRNVHSLITSLLEKSRKEGYEAGKEARQSEIDFLRSEAYGDEDPNTAG